MIDNGTVHGTQERKPKEIERNGNSVYIRSDIQRVSVQQEGMEPIEVWQYQETVLSSAEYDQLSIGAWSGAWTEPLRSVERYILHSATTDDTLEAYRKLRQGDKTIDWQAWLDTLDAYNVAIEETKNQEGYPLTVEYPECPTKPTPQP